MEFKFYGANSVQITANKANLVSDAGATKLGIKIPTKNVNVAVATQNDMILGDKDIFELTTPGEYEVSGFGVNGIAARAHIAEEGDTSITMYKVMTAELMVLITGHIHPDLSDDQLEQIGTVDAVIIPVGGHGYTLDAAGAVSVIKKIEPKIVIPTHYADSGVKYEVPQDSLDAFIKELGAQPQEKTDKLKIKGGMLPEIMQLIELTRS